MSNQSPYQPQPYQPQPYQPPPSSYPLYDSSAAFGLVGPKRPKTLMGYVADAQGVYVVGKALWFYGVIRTLLMMANMAFFFYLACVWFANHMGASGFIGWFVILCLSIIPGRIIAEIGTPKYRRVAAQQQHPLQ